MRARCRVSMPAAAPRVELASAARRTHFTPRLAFCSLGPSYASELLPLSGWLRSVGRFEFTGVSRFQDVLGCDTTAEAKRILLQ